MDYKELIERLNSLSAEHERHGGVTAEAADAIKVLLKERDAAIADLRDMRKTIKCCVNDLSEIRSVLEYAIEWRGRVERSKGG